MSTTEPQPRTRPSERAQHRLRDALHDRVGAYAVRLGDDLDAVGDVEVRHGAAAAAQVLLDHLVALEALRDDLGRTVAGAVAERDAEAVIDGVLDGPPAHLGDDDPTRCAGELPQSLCPDGLNGGVLPARPEEPRVIDLTARPTDPPASPDVAVPQIAGPPRRSLSRGLVAAAAFVAVTVLGLTVVPDDAPAPDATLIAAAADVRPTPTALAVDLAAMLELTSQMEQILGSIGTADLVDDSVRVRISAVLMERQLGLAALVDRLPIGTVLSRVQELARNLRVPVLAFVDGAWRWEDPAPQPGSSAPVVAERPAPAPGASGDAPTRGGADAPSQRPGSEPAAADAPASDPPPRDPEPEPEPEQPLPGLDLPDPFAGEFNQPVPEQGDVGELGPSPTS